MKGVIQKAIRAFALQNAVKFEGKANPGGVIGKIFGQYPDEKKQAKEIQQAVQSTIKEVNALSLEQQQKELEQIAKELPELLETKTKEKKALKDLEHVQQGKVVMRFEPSPSGPLHIGHAYALMLNYAYCKKYGGKIILRIADTNPANIDPDAYDLIQEDFKWLCSDIPCETKVQSDRMEMYYEFALRLIEEGHAYACTCPAEQFRDFAKAQTSCPCRDLGQEKNIKHWKKMFQTKDEGGYDQGEIVIRLKTNMQHKNPAMRDFPLLRISDEEHVRQGKKYRVWPLLNFAVAIDDHEMGLTHVLRGKDHYDNTKRQEYIFDYLKWKKPEYVHIGRINFEGLRLKTSEVRQEIKIGGFTGWTDVRIPFIQALRRRGYQPYAFAKYAEAVGTTMVDKKVQATEFFKAINAFNKEMIDEKSNRLFFIHDPIEIKVSSAPSQKVELDLHPDKQKGGRVFDTHEEFFIAKEDYDNFAKMDEQSMLRLMDCLNLKRKNGNFIFHSTDYENFKQNNGNIIHWLPKEHPIVEVELIMPDNSRITGIGENRVGDLNIGDIIQFERKGFCRLDEKIGKRCVFVFLHK